MARKRLAPKLSQLDLCARLQLQGVQLDRPAISKIETGYREVTDKEAVALARALGVSAAWLLGETEDPRPISHT